MNKKKVFLLFFMLFAFSSAVLAADDWLGDMGLPTGAQAIQFYTDYAAIIDFIIYLVIFIKMADVAFHDKLQNVEGRSFQIGIGVALAIGLTIFMHSQSPPLTLGKLGSIGVLVVLILGGFFVYSTLSNFGGLEKKAAAGIAYLLVYSLVLSFTTNIISWLKAHAQFMLTVLTAFAIISVIMVIMGIIDMFKNKI